MKPIRKKQSYLGGAVTIALGALISKLIGGFFRIPLLSAVGCYGMGLYQMAYPAFCLLLTLCTAGIVPAVSKLVAERSANGDSASPLLSSSFRLFGKIGVFFALFMAVLAYPLSKVQGIDMVGGYLFLAPTLIIAAEISVLRGYFQGLKNMTPTALSEIVEQIFKTVFSLLFVFPNHNDPVRAVRLLFLSLSLSELVALLFLIVVYRARPASKLLQTNNVDEKKRVLRLFFPSSLAAAVSPLAAAVESALVVKLLGGGTDAVATYGLFAGGALTIANLPISLAYGFACSSIPVVSETHAKEEHGGRDTRKKILYVWGITLLVAIPAALCLALFAPLGVKILYRSLSAEEQSVVVSCIRILAIGEGFAASSQTLAATLTALGKPKYTLLSSALSVAVRLLCIFFLLSGNSLGIYGVAIANVVSYSVAFFVNLVYNAVITARGKRYDNDSRFGNGRKGLDEGRRRTLALGKKTVAPNGSDPFG